MALATSVRNAVVVAGISVVSSLIAAGGIPTMEVAYQAGLAGVLAGLVSYRRAVCPDEEVVEPYTPTETPATPTQTLRRILDEATKLDLCG